MTDKPLKITIIKDTIEGEGSDCELCGWNYDTKIVYYFNGEDIWYSHRYGCYGYDQTEGCLFSIMFSRVRDYVEDNNLTEYYFTDGADTNQFWNGWKNCINDLSSDEDVKLKILSVWVENEWDILVEVNI